MKKLKQIGFALLLGTIVSVGCSKSGGDNPTDPSPSTTEYVSKGNVAPSSATAGSYYFDTASKVLYQKKGSSWTAIASISSYTDGDIYLGEGAPTSSISSKYYLNKTDNQLYKKEGNNWVPLLEEGINIPDANFKNALAQWDISPKDGKITIAEAKAPTALYLNDKGIKDLTGIEFFTNLEKLEVNSNQLTKLNIGSLTRLQDIKAKNNNISGFLDFSKLTALNTVEILKGGSNSGITGIKVATKEKANLFNIQDSTHKYTNTDAVDEILNINQKLKECIINSQKGNSSRVDTNNDGEITKQEALAFTGEIRCLASENAVEDISDLIYFSNITSIRIENQIFKNTNIVLKEFSRLETIQLGGNNIRDIIVRDLPSLKTLELLNNQITVVNFSGLPVLNKLVLQKNNLTTIDLSGLSTIKQLNLIGNNLSGTLDISNLSITTDEAPYIQVKRSMPGESNLSNSNLTTIYVANQALADKLNITDAGNKGIFYKTNAGGESGIVTIPDEVLRGIIFRTAFPNKIERTDAITKQEAANFRGKLSLIDSRITNLAGLEYFINVTELEIGASVTTIDLRPFVNLQKITFTNNSILNANTTGLTAITSVDIQARNLQRLDLSLCKNLTKVDIRNNMTIQCVKVPSTLVETLKAKTSYSKDAIKAECN
ncbi:MAG: hypothetical protein Q3983_00185 [Capnocytophaga sp.]|nr:hypothetical protein [Capnocytophaga sp.]